MKKIQRFAKNRFMLSYRSTQEEKPKDLTAAVLKNSDVIDYVDGDNYTMDLTEALTESAYISDNVEHGFNEDARRKYGLTVKN